ncbi:MAG TPA: hypothetical protein VGK10_08585 [Prolixibacteraceae bacterium]
MFFQNSPPNRLGSSSWKVSSTYLVFITRPSIDRFERKFLSTGLVKQRVPFMFPFTRALIPFCWRANTHRLLPDTLLL